MTTTPFPETYACEIGRVAYDALQQSSGGAFGDDKPYLTDGNRDSEAVDTAIAVAARVLADAIAILRAHRWGIAASELREAFAERGIEVGE